jgi:hypothetical protein
VGMGPRGAVAGAVAAALMLLVPLACWPWRDEPGRWIATPAESVHLEVVNQHFHDMVLYLLPDGHRRRLGMVTGLTTGSFDLASHPEVLSRSFRLAAQPIGSRQAYVSELISTFPGDVVVLTVAAQLRMSHWHIRE